MAQFLIFLAGIIFIGELLWTFMHKKNQPRNKNIFEKSKSKR